MLYKPSFSYLIEAQHLNKYCEIHTDISENPVKLHLNAPGELQPKVKYKFDWLASGSQMVSIFYSVKNPRFPKMELKVEVFDQDDNSLGIFTKKNLSFGDHHQTINLKEPVEVGYITWEMVCGKSHFGSGVFIGNIIFYKQNPLTNLANKYGSDKGSEVFYGASPHMYTDIYHQYLSKFRKDSFNLLEIGLDSKTYHTGQSEDAPSLYMWRDYFPKATIYGIDINEYSILDNEERIKFYRANQSSRRELDAFKDSTKEKFRIIIDDASHASSHQQIGLVKLLPMVEKGGYYIIEDLFWQPFKEEATTLDLFTRLKHSGKFTSPFLTDEENEYIEKNVKNFRILKAAVSEMLIIEM